MFTCQAPALAGSATLRLKPPDLEAMKAAVTQADVAALAAQVCVAFASVQKLGSLVLIFKCGTRRLPDNSGMGGRCHGCMTVDRKVCSGCWQ